ncbi:hypothetical protein CBP31_10685 [Oceanisphaera profunda]|uniref:Smp protein n=1 Tax=Oceanisphaera profunda TaxID=1416627 RepID=A0A1Y0D669_9GAMM|nr:hypothetical protein [Oceanisphaera profunda]ART83030.1 hypothetical protein CBP31_10685 [Oceanisphaera profunda]
MWKRLYHPHFSPPKLLLWLLVLGLLLLTAWQGLQVAKLGHAWQTLPQRTLAKPLVDYAAPEAIRALLAEDTAIAQRLVTELAAADLISSAQLYGNDGHLLAESVAGEDAQLKEKNEANTDAKEPSAEVKEPSAEAKKPAPIVNKTSALTYVRPLYQEDQPLGFLRLQLASNPLSLAQHSLWRQLEHHLSWLFPLCLVFGLLLGMAIQHWRQRRALSTKN